MTHSTLFIGLLTLMMLSGCLRITKPEPTARTVEITTPSTMSAENPLQNEQWFAIGALSGVQGHSANGVATVHMLKDGTGIVAVRLNILLAENAGWYEGTIEEEDGSNAISFGRLVSVIGDARHEVRYEHGSEISQKQRKIVIRLRKSASPNDAGEVVAEGLIKVQKR